MDMLNMSLDEIAAKERQENKAKTGGESSSKPVRSSGGLGGRSRRAAPTERVRPMVARMAPVQQATLGPCYCCGSLAHTKVACPHRGKTCNNCGQLGHLTATCRQPMVGQRAMMMGPVRTGCYCCGSTAHDKRDCPHRDKVCNHCGQVGHLAATCRQPAAPVGNPGVGAFGATVQKRCDNCFNYGHIKKDCPEPEMCFRCGKSDHESADCPASDKTCDICGKVGHLKNRCRQT